MKIDYITESFKGIRNKQNNDSFIILDKKYFSIFILFDGVGSAKNPKVGIEKASNYIKKNFRQFIIGGRLSLKDLMYKTNQYVLNENIDEPYTTYVALYIDKEHDDILISGLGDSRIYGISKQYINQYSKDDKSKISNTITKCLGIKGLKKEDFKEDFVKKAEKRLLLCSDGFYCFLEDNKLNFFELLNFNNLKKIQKKIIKEIRNKNEDDASYILINLYI